MLPLCFVRLCLATTAQLYLLYLLQVMRSIRDNITEDILLNEIYEIIRLPMYADRINIDSKAAHQHANMQRRR